MSYYTFQATGLTSIEDLGSTTELQDGIYERGVFFNCKSLQSVILPSTITKIGNYAFHNCSALELVICHATSVPTLGSSNYFNNAVIYVPDGTVDQEVDNGDGTTSTVTKTIVELYKEASGWIDYADRIYPMSVYESGGVASIITFEDPAVEAICLANWDNNKDGYFTKA